MGKKSLFRQFFTKELSVDRSFVRAFVPFSILLSESEVRYSLIERAESSRTISPWH